MAMHLESRNREAFELVTDALQCIDQYRESRDVTILDSAKQKLVLAVDKDPAYFRAHYYGAIVDDLAGQQKRAVETLALLLEEKPPFAEEVRYNLGVAWYHHYNHKALDEAIRLFSSVSASTDPSLHLLAHAGLAQAHAMHMIPTVPDRPDLDQIRRHFDLATKESTYVFRELKRKVRWSAFRKSEVSTVTSNEIVWTAHNARGMALMYWTDYLPPSDSGPTWRRERVRMLQESVTELDQADQVSPLNWANYCDRASARMRLGYYQGSSGVFTRALELLEVVVERLRPGYGFAVYEMGRIHRLTGDFERAAEHFERVLGMPHGNRDIGDRRLEIELSRAQQQDRSFP